MCNIHKNTMFASISRYEYNDQKKMICTIPASC